MTEECDDGNLDPGDGCDENCAIETATFWECTNVPETLSECNLICGNGKLEASNTELCDDDNNEDLDGCDSTC